MKMKRWSEIIEKTEDLMKEIRKPEEVVRELIEDIDYGFILDIRAKEGRLLDEGLSTGTFEPYQVLSDGLWVLAPWHEVKLLPLAEYLTLIKTWNKGAKLKVSVLSYKAVSQKVLDEVINWAQGFLDGNLDGYREAEKVLHEKILVAKALMENSYDEKNGLYRATLRECFNALVDSFESRSALARWFYVFAEGADWEEQLYDIVRLYVPFPDCPQEYKYDTVTPLEMKMRDDAFRRYYEEYRDLGQFLMDKYRSVYEPIVQNWEKQGKKGSFPYGIFPDSLIPGVGRR